LKRRAPARAQGHATLFLQNAISKVVQIGGRTTADLLVALRNRAVALNESAERLFASPLFTTLPERLSITIVELAVEDLGFPQGATISEIVDRAVANGLGYCPLELGLHLRLQYLDQPEGFVGQPVRAHQAPVGSITIVSEPLDADDDFPKGFYLRRIEGVLWLRGYQSGADHIWSPDDRLVFRQT
jgi:hypothetical protein